MTRIGLISFIAILFSCFQCQGQYYLDQFLIRNNVNLIKSLPFNSYSYNYIDSAEGELMIKIEDTKLDENGNAIERAHADGSRKEECSYLNGKIISASYYFLYSSGRKVWKYDDNWNLVKIFTIADWDTSEREIFTYKVDTTDIITLDDEKNVVKHVILKYKKGDVYEEIMVRSNDTTIYRYKYREGKLAEVVKNGKTYAKLYYADNGLISEISRYDSENGDNPVHTNAFYFDNMNRFMYEKAWFKDYKQHYRTWWFFILEN